ncbi:MAG: hypothetical protein G01um101416_1074 [Microgenomates group bacterium Gr01-1014_16]|nr:MAG: hypothetical protein G01um101416_1074 [Microgenomates group bacterium Gr01-1014_16]
MALPPPSNRSKTSLEATLLYFSKYNYPLISAELWFWQHQTSFSKLKIDKFIEHWTLNTEHSKTRKQRELISQQKWVIARGVGDKLRKIPFVEAIFVTGSLAMSNCTPNDDVDLMIITSPNTLWLTRLLVYLAIRHFRRKPNVLSAPDKICDNLYLDTYHLPLTTHNLYYAHEILQAKCIFDRGGTHRQFLLANPWVKTYLPVAYRESLRHLSLTNYQLTNQLTILLYPINLLLFWLQYLYMLPKMTTERVSLGSAFFHPASKA